MMVQIMYFGRPSDFLLMTSERLDIADETCSLEQVLNRLRKRGEKWAYELADCHVVCTINQDYAELTTMLEDRDEIGIFSRKPCYEI